MTTAIAFDGQSELLTVRHVAAEGDQTEIGRTLAEVAHHAHGDVARPRTADPAEERVRLRWFEVHHPALAARGREVAEQLEVDPDDRSVEDPGGSFSTPVRIELDPLPAGVATGSGTGTK